jgi:hypothetical protein
MAGWSSSSPVGLAHGCYEPRLWRPQGHALGVAALPSIAAVSQDWTKPGRGGHPLHRKKLYVSAVNKDADAWCVEGEKEDF